MNILRNLSIAFKVLIPLAILILALSIIIVISFAGFSSQSGSLKEANDIALNKISQIQDLHILLYKLESDMLRVSLQGYADFPIVEKAEIESRIERTITKLDTIYGYMEGWETDGEERTLIQSLQNPIAVYVERAALATARRAESGLEAEVYRQDAAAFDTLNAGIVRLVSYEKDVVSGLRDAALESASKVKTAVLATAVFLAVLSSSMAIFISNRVISGPIRKMTGVMTGLPFADVPIAPGDLERSDEVGEIARALETFKRNAFEKQIAEEELNKRERLLAEAGAMARFGGWEHDLRTGKAVWTQILYDIIEIPLGDDPPGVEEHLNYYPPEDQEILSRAYKRAIDEGESFDLELRVFTRTRKRKWCRVQGEALFEDGKCVKLYGVFQDITRRKEAEIALQYYSQQLEQLVESRTAQLKQAQDLLLRKEKLAVLGELAGGVGHELRNPLGAIKNGCYFLNLALENPAPQVREAIDILNNEVENAERIISGLLDFARTRASALRRVNLSELLLKTVDRIELPADGSVSVAIDNKYEDLAVFADTDQLSQVLDNLCTNAVQAMPDGGRLTLSISLQPEDWISIDITDTGEGISEDNVEKIFEPLFTTKAKGIGLGLAVVSALVEKNGGKIEVRSKERVGTTFSVLLRSHWSGKD